MASTSRNKRGFIVVLLWFYYPLNCEYCIKDLKNKENRTGTKNFFHENHRFTCRASSQLPQAYTRFPKRDRNGLKFLSSWVFFSSVSARSLPKADMLSINEGRQLFQFGRLGQQWVSHFHPTDHPTKEISRIAPSLTLRSKFDTPSAIEEKG